MSIPDGLSYPVSVTRVLVGQRSALLAGAVSALLSGQRDLRVVALLSAMDDVLAGAAWHRPDVAVLDGRMPGTITLGELCHQLRRAVPLCRPLVLLDRGQVDLSRSLARLAPWLGLLSTDSTPSVLAEGIRRLARGAPYLDGALAAGLVTAQPNPLTAREADMLRRARHGTPPKEIASQLRLSVGTVRNHLHRAVAKAGARNRLEAIRIADHAGWI